MTLKLKKIRVAIEAARADPELILSEDPGQLHLAGLMSERTLAAWQSVMDEPCDLLSIECKDDTDDSIRPEDGIPGDRHRLTIRFTSRPITPRLFTIEGWRSFLYSDSAIESAEIVQLAFISEGFKTLAFRVEPWVELSENLISEKNSFNNENSPRRQVRSQSADFMAPARIEPWILITSPSLSNSAINIWSGIAAKKIASSLANELYIDNGIDTVVLFGKPPRRIAFGDFCAFDSIITSLQDAAKWVYLDGKDIEVRHTFLSGELAREWATDCSFSEGIALRMPGALDSAHLIYKAHLRSGSKDTLKALADLRKTLAEEVQRLLQQTRDLSSAVWRDVAIAIGVLAIRLSMSNAKVNDSITNFALIYIAVALYIAVSYSITLSTDAKFLKIAHVSRKSWRNKLYAFLDDGDYQTLADIPIKSALDGYKIAKNRTTFVVIIVVLVLLISTAIEMHWIDTAQFRENIFENSAATYCWLKAHLAALVNKSTAI